MAHAGEGLNHHGLMFDVVMMTHAIATGTAAVEPAWVEEPVPPERGEPSKDHESAPGTNRTGEHVTPAGR